MKMKKPKLSKRRRRFARMKRKAARRKAKRQLLALQMFDRITDNQRWKF